MSEIKGMLRDALVLLVITVVAGVILGYVYQITKDPIAQAKEKAANEAYMEVFPDASSFEEVSALLDSEELLAEYPKDTIDQVLAAKDPSGSVLGYVLTVTSKEGYGGNITLTIGIQSDGTVNGISILSISETAGLGMRAEEVLKPQFAGKKVSEFSYTKTGASLENQIDAISGATITTNAVTNAVNAGLSVFQTLLGGGES